MQELAKAEDGTVAAVCRASSSVSASSTAFVISSTKRGMPSVRSIMSCLMLSGQQLIAHDAINHSSDFALVEAIETECSDVGPAQSRAARTPVDT